jgi:hypothetical protein
VNHIILIAILFFPLCAANPGQWIRLFDGKTLNGWRMEGKADWKVEGGAILGRQGPGNKGGDLYTEQQWGDFELEAEFQMSSPGNSGIWFRVSAAQPGYQVDFIDEAAWPNVYSGSLYCMGKGFLVKNSDPATIRKTGWNKMRLVVVGNSITVVMNGTTVVKTNDATFPKSGSIGIQTHPGKDVNGMEVRVRNIRIRPLDEAKRV